MSLEWLMKSMQIAFPGAHLHITNHSIGITMNNNGTRQWYGKLIKIPSKKDRQVFLSDTVKWFNERFGIKS